MWLIQPGHVVANNFAHSRRSPADRSHSSLNHCDNALGEVSLACAQLQESKHHTQIVLDSWPERCQTDEPACSNQPIKKSAIYQQSQQRVSGSSAPGCMSQLHLVTLCICWVLARQHVGMTPHHDCT